MVTKVEKDIVILAIESSCDETAAAVVKNGREVCSNIISTQIALHTLYGGVVPDRGFGLPQHSCGVYEGSGERRSVH